jgi:probable F420-dependent oxidoreductase
MKLDTALTTRDLREVPAAAKAAEAAGFDAIWSMEAGNDGFLPLALAAEHTQRIKMGPAVAIAFPRSPMSMAYVAWDLARLSKGRFILGLGTQVKGHIERRYGVRWEAPVPKLREYLESLRAIFKCWAEGGKKLSYKGKYYNFSLMTPFFAPSPHEYSNIPIYIAGVNEHICRLAGELCEGLHAHPFNSPKYLREFVLPNVEAGLKKAGKQRKDFTIATMAFVVVGKNDAEIEKAREGVRQQISFYASTRTYKVVLDTHGWGDVAARLNEKAAKGDWNGMAKEITDEMLDVYSVAGNYDNIAEKVKARYGGLLDRVAFYVPYRAGLDEDGWRRLNREFNG